jgi:hypothetical protein
MNKLVIALAAGALLAGCGEKMQEAKNAMNMAESMQDAAKNMEEGQDEATKFYKERQEKGDTIAMPYAELQKMLPASIDGYTAEGGPSGSQNNMMGVSISEASQKYVSGPPEDQQRMEVKIIDYGGTQSVVSMAMLPAMMNMSSEDDHQRTATLKVDVPYTSGFSTYNKDSKEANITLGTRYRYWVNVIASNQKEDQSKMAEEIATDVAKKFEGK